MFTTNKSVNDIAEDVKNKLGGVQAIMKKKTGKQVEVLGSGDKGTPVIHIQGYFDNYTTGM